MSKPYAVVFAGVPGSSKTIVSNYLSVKFNLPVFNNDQLRFEVKEDMLADNITRPDVLTEYEKRHAERLKDFLQTKHSFIFDGSMDRRWEEVKDKLESAGYGWYLISMDLSKPFLENLYRRTGRAFFLEKFDNYWQQHEGFLAKHSSDIGLSIKDKMFHDRLQYAATGLEGYQKSI